MYDEEKSPALSASYLRVSIFIVVIRRMTRVVYWSNDLIIIVL